jgi:hypothetical protein
VDQERLTDQHLALQRKEKSIRSNSRMGYGISIFGILAGLFPLYMGDKLQHTTIALQHSIISFPAAMG